MTNRPVAPSGAPCWVDLWTSDVEGSRTLPLAAAHGATVQLPAMAIDDLGVQAVIADPAGAGTGICSPAAFPASAWSTSTAPRALSPSMSMIATGRSPSIAKFSAGAHSRRRPTVITTSAISTGTTTDQSPGSATWWSR